MIDTSIYEVSRAEYKSFLETIKPSAREVKEEQVDKRHVAIKTFSKNTGKCLASRLTTIQDDIDGNHEPEKYYIFELPEKDESLPPIPKISVVLETKEEVQAFLEGIKKMKEQEENG